jgi:2-keto-3-deoxy-L-rhamnonate aldolase RhmA
MLHPLVNYQNDIKERMRRGEVTKGIFALSASSIVVEAFSTMPIDWILVDCEASPATNHDVIHMFQALSGSAVSPMIRVAELSQHLIEHALDLGARGILVPKIHSGAMARRVVESACFPPKGQRGINPVRSSGYFADVPGYLRTANHCILCMVQIESREAVDRVDEIARVDGIDVLFIGPGDLASSLGQPGEVTGPVMDAAIRRVLESTIANGKIPGIFAYSSELARKYIGEGFRFVAVGNDVKIMKDGLRSLLDAISISRRTDGTHFIRSRCKQWFRMRFFPASTSWDLIP